MNWTLLDTGIQSAEENMQLDGKLLDQLDQPTLHFYEWKNKSATYGYFLRPERYLDVEAAMGCGLDLARRPTGGGIVFHVWDFAFSVLIPAGCPLFSQNTLQNYAFVNTAVLHAVEAFLGQKLYLTREDLPSFDRACAHFCMAKPTKYDVIFEGKKIAGAAQRRTKKGFLHQGTIALQPPCFSLLEKVLLPETKVQQAMQAYTLPLLPSSCSSSEIQDAKTQLKHLLQLSLQEEG